MNAKQRRCWRRETSAFRQVRWWEASAQASKTLRERNWTSNHSKEDSQFHSQVPKLTKSRQKKKEHTNQDRLSHLIWIWQKLGNIFFLKITYGKGPNPLNNSPSSHPRSGSWKWGWSWLAKRVERGGSDKGRQSFGLGKGARDSFFTWRN